MAYRTAKVQIYNTTHLRSDRTAIAYRQWLHQLGLTFGTA